MSDAFKEPLRLRADRNGYGDLEVKDATADVIYFDGTRETIVFDANELRRIVACVNACAQLSTEELLELMDPKNRKVLGIVSPARQTTRPRQHPGYVQ